jgi:O-antigen/teichoic acid export membrane protein
LNRQLNVHIIWNLASVGVLAVTGLAANTLIGRLDGPVVLGVFTQVTSLFFVTSQLSMLGINFSVLKHVAEFRNDADKAKLIARTGLGLTLLYAIAFGALAYLTVPLVEYLLKSEDVAKAWTIAIPTLIAFNLNKTLLAVLNAHERMITFAIFMGSRFVFVLLIFWIFVTIDAPTYWVGGIVGLAEVVVLLFLLPLTLPQLGKLWRGYSKEWAVLHFKYGMKGYLTAISLEINSKLTVIVSGVFLSDAAVGIYSMATMFLDGLLQFANSVRNNFNPIITRYFVTGDVAGLEQLIKKTKRHVFFGSLYMSVGALILFPVFTTYVLNNPEYMDGMIPLCFLVTGMMLCSARFPFTMIFIQTGHPGMQTIYNGSFTFLNILFNLALTPFFAASGAAAGTALSLASAAWLLGILAKRRLGIRV